MATLEVNGVTVYYEWHGAETAPVLVLNNGILMNAAGSWLYQTKVLAQHYRVLQYDCRGQGQSEHPTTAYSMELHAADLAALLTGLEVERAHIAGISYGGEVAQAFALQYPERVRSLILADTVSEIWADLRIVGEAWLGLARANDPDGFFLATAPWNFSTEFMEKNPQVLAGARQRYAALDLAAVARLCEAFLQVDFTARLGEIQAPTCVLVGGQDRLKGVNYASLIHDKIVGSELHVLAGAGHASCWERPAEFNTVILGFLAKQV